MENDSKPGSNKTPVIVAVIVIVLVVGVGVAIAASRNKSKPAPANTSNQPSSNQSSTSPSASNSSSTSTSTTNNQVAISITAGDYYFSPKTIKVSKGSKVKITMTAKDMTHNFNIDELNVHLPDTSPGSTNSVEFTADTAGSFEFYCSIDSHRRLGQVGTLTVE